MILLTIFITSRTPVWETLLNITGRILIFPKHQAAVIMSKYVLHSGQCVWLMCVCVCSGRSCVCEQQQHSSCRAADGAAEFESRWRSGRTRADEGRAEDQPTEQRQRQHRGAGPADAHTHTSQQRWAAHGGITSALSRSDKTNLHPHVRLSLSVGRTPLAAANEESQCVTDDAADEIMERIVRSATQSPRERAQPRERRRSRANRKSCMLIY